MLLPSVVHNDDANPTTRRQQPKKGLLFLPTQKELVTRVLAKGSFRNQECPPCRLGRMPRRPRPWHGRIPILWWWLAASVGAARLPGRTLGFVPPSPRRVHRGIRWTTPEEEKDPPLTPASDRAAPAQGWAHALRPVTRALLTVGVALSLAFPSFAADPGHLAAGQKYWTIMNTGESQAKVEANTALMDYAVGTINTQYYDHSGGAFFQPKDFFKSWKKWLGSSDASLGSRDGVIDGMHWLTRELNDPFSRYLTRDELREELTQNEHGFLHLGVVVEAPSSTTFFRPNLGTPVLSEIPPALVKSSSTLLSARRVESLPVATAVAPNSHAERMGITVGDRIVAVQQESFIGKDAAKAVYRWKNTYDKEPTEITIAKPVYAATMQDDRDVIVAYRPQRLRLPESSMLDPEASLVRYELLQGRQSSLFGSSEFGTPHKVGYIRLTRFSKATTAAFLEAVDELEKLGTESYILDLRNNYGGVIQEAMLTASSLLRDPHAVLCYTMNSRGGFTPHDVEEYVVDARYPGYLLSGEARSVTLQQVQRESPEFFNGKGWSPPSSYASLHEQSQKRGIRRAPVASTTTKGQQRIHQLASQKSLVILVNEGTASSAEVFASAVRDNGRAVALIGTKTFGKGLIQHTFPLPDGGGLRLTIAEYLTPSLRHVTNVGGAQFDQSSGSWVGGGVVPDILCESKGIPSNIGADFCVGFGLDTLSEADFGKNLPLLEKRAGAGGGGVNPVTFDNHKKL